MPADRTCLILGILASVTLNSPPVAALDLTGVWSGNDGGLYYITQFGDSVWWAGLYVDSPNGLEDSSIGVDGFTNVFNGTVKELAPGRYEVTGDWADVPRGVSLNYGTLALSFENIDPDNPNSGYLIKESETGGFGGS